MELKLSEMHRGEGVGNLKLSTLKQAWKKLIPTMTDDSEGFECPVNEITSDLVNMARELELEALPEGVTELPASH